MLNTDSNSKDNLQLTAFIKDRNQQSMEYIYDKYSPALYGIIYRIINNNHLAEECLMTTFLKAWNGIPVFKRSDTSIFTWLLTIARQAAFEVLEREKEKTTMIHGFETGHGRHFSAFELVYSKGLNFSQAAELSGLSLKELKFHLRTDLKIRNDKTKKV